MTKSVFQTTVISSFYQYPITFLTLCLWNHVFLPFANKLIRFGFQYGFQSSDYCFNKRKDITHKIYCSLGKNYLKSSLAHVMLLTNWLKHNGISGNLLELQTNFLKDKKQSVVFNRKSLSKANVIAAVPQIFILRPFLKIQPIWGLDSICRNINFPFSVIYTTPNKHFENLEAKLFNRPTTEEHIFVNVQELRYFERISSSAYCDN